MKIKYLMLIPLSILLMGCGDNKDKNQNYDPVIPVSVQVLNYADDTNFRNYVGSLKSEVKMSLSFPIGGELTRIYVHNGQKVKKGDIIAQVDETTAKSLHDMALASLNQAEDGYDRLKQVHEEGGISEVRWVQMETDLEKARQTEISTRKHLEDCTIYAPQDGVVSMNDRHIGEYMRPSEAFCHLIDMDKLIVEFSIPEKEIGLVNVGDKAFADIYALDNLEREVTIYDKSIVANPFGHTYTVKARIDLNGKNALPGMVVKIRLSQTSLAGIVVPASCVQTVSNGLAVWALKNGRSYRRIIDVSDFVKNGVLVKSGLEHGDTIVTVGYQKLFNGAKVSIK